MTMNNSDSQKIAKFIDYVSKCYHRPIHIEAYDIVLKKYGVEVVFNAFNKFRSEDRGSFPPTGGQLENIIDNDNPESLVNLLNEIRHWVKNYTIGFSVPRKNILQFMFIQSKCGLNCINQYDDAFSKKFENEFFEFCKSKKSLDDSVLTSKEKLHKKQYLRDGGVLTNEQQARLSHDT